MSVEQAPGTSGAKDAGGHRSPEHMLDQNTSKHSRRTSRELRHVIWENPDVATHIIGHLHPIDRVAINKTSRVLNSLESISPALYSVREDEQLLRDFKCHWIDLFRKSIESDDTTITWIDYLNLLKSYRALFVYYNGRLPLNDDIELIISVQDGVSYQKDAQYAKDAINYLFPKRDMQPITIIVNSLKASDSQSIEELSLQSDRDSVTDSSVDEPGSHPSRNLHLGIGHHFRHQVLVEPFLSNDIAQLVRSTKGKTQLKLVDWTIAEFTYPKDLDFVMSWNTHRALKLFLSTIPKATEITNTDLHGIRRISINFARSGMDILAFDGDSLGALRYLSELEINCAVFNSITFPSSLRVLHFNGRVSGPLQLPPNLQVCDLSGTLDGAPCFAALPHIPLDLKSLSLRDYIRVHAFAHCKLLTRFGCLTSILHGASQEGAHKFLSSLDIPRITDLTLSVSNLDFDQLDAKYGTCLRSMTLQDCHWNAHPQLTMGDDHPRPFLLPSLIGFIHLEELVLQRISVGSGTAQHQQLKRLMSFRLPHSLTKLTIDLCPTLSILDLQLCQDLTSLTIKNQINLWHETVLPNYLRHFTVVQCTGSGFETIVKHRPLATLTADFKFYDALPSNLVASMERNGCRFKIWRS